MRKLLTIVFVLNAVLTQAQTTFNKFQWQAAPVLHPVDKEFSDAPAVYVSDSRIVEYAIEKDGFFVYHTMHRIVHINNDKGIESFNKIYLPFGDDVNVVDVKARTIQPDGKIIELDKNNIKELKEEDGQYKIFALDGLSKGCEVEYYYTIKRDPSFFGKEVLSSRLPAMKTHFELIAPEHLIFETKCYNNLPAGKDTVINQKRYLIVDDAKVPEAEEEKYSMYQASLKRVEYKLSYNKAKNANERLFTWNDLAKRVFEIYTTISDKENKRVKELLSDMQIKGTTDAEKITAIENYLKKNFVTRENIPDEDAGDLGKVIKNKLASHKAICKLYIALLTNASVDYQIVFTGDRSDYTIDKSFENWNNTKNFLIYFPTARKFIAPTEIEYRYPWIPPTWAATNGLFCIGTTIGNFTTAIGEVRPVAMEAYEHNVVNMEMNLKLDKDDALIVDVKQIYGGYAAPNYRVPFVFLPADQQDKVLKDMIKFGTNSENIISHSFENKEIEETDPYKPFIINASVKSTNLIDRAGEKLIIKIGEVIGQQAEMYDTKPRNTDVSLEFPHSLTRTIQLTIPEGYKVKNLTDLNVNQVFKENDKETMGFVCHYEQKGNVLKITVREDYLSIHYPLQQYEQFKKVINAAADFNKIVLVLDKGSS